MWDRKTIETVVGNKFPMSGNPYDFRIQNILTSVINAEKKLCGAKGHAKPILRAVELLGNNVKIWVVTFMMF